MTVLKLDDLILDDPAIELKGKTYYLNVSLKAVITFEKWVNNLKEKEKGTSFDVIRMLVKEPEPLINDMEDMGVASQTTLVGGIIRLWSENINPTVETTKEDSKKK